jgi:hypothetical protein
MSSSSAEPAPAQPRPPEQATSSRGTEAPRTLGLTSATGLVMGSTEPVDIVPDQAARAQPMRAAS